VAPDPKDLDQREGKNQLSRLLEYLPAIFREPPDDSRPLPLGRFLMAFESILLGLPKNIDAECRDLLYQPGFEEILGGAVRQGTTSKLLDGIQRYFDPIGQHDPAADSKRVENYNRAPAEFLSWLAGWVALSLRDDWTDDHKRKFIANAVQLYRLRGTKAGVAGFVETYTGWPVEILEGDDAFFFKVKLKVGGLVFQKQTDIVNAIVELQKPAHTSFKLEVETVQFQIGKTATIGGDTLLGLRGG
jgi:phage tail-like protein